MSLDDLLHELRTEYTASLPTKITELTDAFAAKKLDILQDLFHKLKGSGKTYGISEISDIGRVMENVCMYCPQELDWALPIVTTLMHKIHLHYSSGNSDPVLLSTDTDYSKLSALYRSESP